MIPLSAEATFDVKDPDGGPVVFHLRYLIEKDATNRFLKLVNQAKSKEKIDGWDYDSELIDLFLCGWSGAKAQFPSDGKPSKCFRAADRSKIVDLISVNINELTGLGIKESKN